MITSRQNPHIKQVRSLRRRKDRDRSGLYLVEGIAQVGEAMAAAAPIETIVFAPDLLTSRFGQDLVRRAGRAGIQVLECQADVFATLSEKSAPVGLIAVLRQGAVDLASLSPDNFSRGAALVAPQDPGNLGTTLRTLDAVGADGLVLLDGGVDPWHPTAVRASMGALFWQLVVQTDSQDFLAWAHRHGYHLYGTSAYGDSPPAPIPGDEAAIVLFGSEQKGLPDGHRAACERVFGLPMRGHVRSLNLGVAAGIILYTCFGAD